MQNKQKRLSRMTTAELREATKEFDKEFVVDTFRPLTAKDQALHRAAQKRAQRSSGTNGVKVISIRLKRDLVSRVDNEAKKRGVSRARLIAEGLSMILAKAS